MNYADQQMNLGMSYGGNVAHSPFVLVQAAPYNPHHTPFPAHHQFHTLTPTTAHTVHARPPQLLAVHPAASFHAQLAAPPPPQQPPHPFALARPLAPEGREITLSSLRKVVREELKKIVPTIATQTIIREEARQQHQQHQQHHHAAPPRPHAAPMEMQGGTSSSPAPAPAPSAPAPADSRMTTPTRIQDLGSEPDLIGSVCRHVAGGDKRLGNFVGLDGRLCGAWARSDGEDRAACEHTFKHGNTDALDRQQAVACMNTLFTLGGLSDHSDAETGFDSVSEMLSCVTPTEPCALDKMVNVNCRAFFASPMLLSRNENYETCVDAETEASFRRRERVAREETPVREVVRLLDTQDPDDVDSAVTQIMSVCEWDKAAPTDRDALNRMLSIYMKESPASVRRICNEGNMNCDRLERKEDICSAIQKNVGTSSYLSKIYDYYAQGEMTGLRSVRLSDADRFPAPFGKIFDEILLACRVNTPDRQTAVTQTNVMHSLIRTPNDDTNRRICSRIEGTDSVLPQMTREMAHTISTMAGV